MLTFDQLSYLLFVQVVTMLVDKSPQEVLEAVVDLGARRLERHPLLDRVTLHVLQVLDTFDHLQRKHVMHTSQDKT